MQDNATGAQGRVKRLLQLEGLALLAAAVGMYVRIGAGWKLFAILILVPDIAMLFYVAGPRAGAMAYNATHTTLGPIATLTAGYLLSVPLAIDVGLIWAAHVGFDRALGYGLKYGAGFGYTHLGRIGRAARATVT
ncbi:MAG: DUF4260 domain-containing protein [Rhizomicrobium sp.]|jgi:hypothetical protein